MVLSSVADVWAAVREVWAASFYHNMQTRAKLDNPSYQPKRCMLWLCSTAVTACSYGKLRSIVHLLFLFILSACCLWRNVHICCKSVKENPVVTRERPSSGSVVQSAVTIHVAIGSCLSLGLFHLGLAVWTIFYAGTSACFSDSSNLVRLLAEVHVVGWLVMAILTDITRREKLETFPSILRWWWFSSLLLSLLSLGPVADFHVNGHHLSLNMWVDIVSAPLCGLLFLFAVRGKTGIVAIDMETQPLLTEVQQDGPGITLYATASIFSQASVSWISPLLSLGARRHLELTDLPLLAPKDRAEHSYLIVKRNWEQAEVAHPSKSPSLLLVIIKSFWRGALFNATLSVVNSLVSYVGPYLIDDFVEYLAGRRRFAMEGYALILIFTSSKVIETLVYRQWYIGLQLLGLHFRSALTPMVYYKGLRLSNKSRQSHTNGEIVNYVTVDVQRIGDFLSWYLHNMCVLPLTISLALLILVKVVGLLPALAAMTGAIVTVAANVPLARMQEKYQHQLMIAKDKRMKAVTECLRSMRVLKFQAWEQKYLKIVENLRSVEYAWLRKSLYTSGVSTFVFWSAPMFVAAMTFGTCVLLKTELTAGRILSALATFRILQDPLSQIPEIISMLAQSKVSLERLQKYFEQEELQDDAVIRKSTECLGDDISIEIEGGNFSWSEEEQPTLSNVDLHVRKGQRVAVCGTVGSGKSSLLLSILGEIPKISGTVKVCGTTAYVAQSAWIQTGTIQDNILFGRSMDRIKYEQILAVCALNEDLKQFSFGDHTMIGERGINLSGGQKQRVQLARALYQDCDTYLLDDPFSAVDAHTGSHLFKECVLKALDSKTLVFVTHQIELLPTADLIVVLRSGEIVQAGKYDELLQAGTDFGALVGAHVKAIDIMDASRHRADDDGEELNTGEVNSDVPEIEHQGDARYQQQRFKETSKSSDPSKRQIVEDEERERGGMNFSVYWAYLTATHKGALIPVIILLQILFQVLQIASNFWMVQSTPAAPGEPQQTSSVSLILVYVLLAFGSCVVISSRALLTAIVGFRSAQKFCLNMLSVMFRAPMSFFDSTPTGRILSRASSDQQTLDSQIVFFFSGFLQWSIQALGIIVVMSQVTWEVLLLFLLVGLLNLWMQRYYIKSSRELQRLVGILRAPIILHYGESIAGAATIRGFGQSQRFMAKTLNLCDNYAGAVFHNFTGLQWLQFRMETLTNLVFSFALIYAVLASASSTNPSLAGLAITYGFQLNHDLAWWLWCFSNLENTAISVERLHQYSCIESEAPLFIEETRPSKNWPAQGAIELQDLQVRYNAHSPLVLHGITCTIVGGQKVGVVGRTGSGKSTLVQALFRMIEPASGRITIDGVDICTIGLHDLRSKLSIIPQDPTMFEGTIRSNLDVLGEHTDDELWEALRKCQLAEVIYSKEEKLESSVSENGDNWSVGQRQLVCLGRSLLKRSRILVLDEATASVDSITDGSIQRTIRSEFGSCTVITVAHRIPTVIDCDRVLVLNEGRVAEYDSPSKLLDDKSSLFYKLVSEYTSRSL